MMSLSKPFAIANHPRIKQLKINLKN